VQVNRRKFLKAAGAVVSTVAVPVPLDAATRVVVFSPGAPGIYFATEAQARLFNRNRFAPLIK